MARSDSGQNQHRAINASLRPPRYWRRLRGRPSATWLRRLMLMCSTSRLTSVSTQSEGRPTTVFSVDVSSTREYSIRVTPLKKITLVLGPGVSVLVLKVSVPVLVLTITLLFPSLGYIFTDRFCGAGRAVDPLCVCLCVCVCVCVRTITFKRNDLAYWPSM